MTIYLVIGLIGALATGFAIGFQSTLSSKIGNLIGSFRSGVMINFIGGMLAALFFVVLLIVKGKEFWQMPGISLTLIVIAGALDIMIITGIAFSLQRIGVAAGLAAVILGQMVVSLIVDAKGWGGSTPIPITLPRILGVVIIAVGVYILLPRK